MKDIVYLLGAGASFGKRDANNPSLFVKDFLSQIQCANIIEGLPLVTEIPGRIAFVIEKLEIYDYSNETRNLSFPIENGGNTGFYDALNQLIQDLSWLKIQSAKHATIDTFSKKLYLKKNYSDFYKVEMLLSIYFIIEQILNKIDSRYDTFLASVLNQELNISDRISILTWNYDSQFELAYNEYNKNISHDELINDLGIIDLKEFSNTNRKQIFKLNGTANFLNQIDLNKYQIFNDQLVSDLLNVYIKSKNEDNKSRISFAWDNKKYLSNFFQQLKDAISGAEVLVIIGYTFPFFNREIDKKIFDEMPNLRKIYIQDPNAGQLVYNLDAVLSSKNKIHNVHKNINTITNTSQFFLPPEL